MKRIKSDHSATMGSINSGKIISRYVKKNALFAMLFAILGLWALQLVFAYLAELEDFTDTYTYVDALKYIAYRSPYFLEQFAPTGALLGAVIGLGLLANNSELIVMRAAGLSIYRIVGWVLQPALIFVILALAVNQYVLPQTNLKASQIRKPDTALLASVNGYWTLQDSPDSGDNSKDSGKTILYIDYADANGNIGRVKRWYLDDDNNLTAVSKATDGVYVPNAGGVGESLSKPAAQSNAEQTDSTSQIHVDGSDHINHEWRLNNITTLQLAERAAIAKSEDLIVTGAKAPNSDNANTADADTGDASVDSMTQNNTMQFSNIILNDQPLVTSKTEASDTISLPISPSSVYLLTRRAEDLSLTQLYEHQRFNASQGTRSLEHEVAFWQKLLSPFAILSLVIVACSFVFGSLRTHSLGLRIVVALVFGLLFSYIQDLTSFISLATGASPLLMVLVPILGSAALGFYLIKRQG